MNCLVCHQPFIPTSPNPQKYCNKKCAIIANKKQQKERYHYNKVTPDFTCQSCGHKTKLSFFPLKDPKKWLSYKCNKCGNKAQVLK